jgi:hypothetical protein
MHAPRNDRDTGKTSTREHNHTYTRGRQKHDYQNTPLGENTVQEYSYPEHIYSYETNTSPRTDWKRND